MTTTDTDGHGLGIDRLADFAPDVAYGHAGSQAGYSALLAVLPERHAVIVVFVNDETADPFTGTSQPHRRVGQVAIQRSPAASSSEGSCAR